ncbi:MAG: MerR family transcriptional regulator, partial [Actinobacteria bacterium]|nr:MerR family transcriptional regulator [Actinomycetota bacterium]
MADIGTNGHLAIGEVLGILLEEFPDVTISKIRFLESQGLIAPERTASGYRKFYEADVDLLRVILTEQKDHYLPLRVIKDRLDSGEIDPSGEHLRPRDAVDPSGPVEVPEEIVKSHPSAT